MFRSSRAVVDGRMLPYTRTGGMPVAPPLVPGLADLKLWYDALQIVGLNDGDSVSTWLDSSSSGNDASVNLTYGTAPTYKIISDLPCVRFDGIDNLLMSATNTFTATYTQPATIAIAYTTRDEFVNAKRFFGQQGNSNDYVKYIARADFSSTDVPEAASTRVVVADDTAMADTSAGIDELLLAIGVWNGTNIKYYHGNVLQDTRTIGPTVQGATANTKPWCIGGIIENGSTNFISQVDIHEILVYDIAADTTLVDEIAIYFNKWVP